MNNRVQAMLAFVARRLDRMMRNRRAPGTNPAAELMESLRREWPDITPFELAQVTVGLAETVQRAEQMRPANTNRRQ